MSLTEYAAHRGVTKQAISDLKRKGKLPLDADGRVQVMAADALLAQILHPTKGGANGSRALAEPPAPPPARGSSGIDAAADGQLSYTDAARAEKMQRVRLLSLEIAERSGKLVQREDVDRQAFARARQALEALLAIPDRLAPLLAAEADPHRVHVMLDDELRRVAAQLAASPEPTRAEAA